MANDLKQRTKYFALDCWKLCSQLPRTREYNAYVNQLIRSSSSVGANYRASQRAKSTADFLNKLKIVEEEIDESDYFLELLFEVSQMERLNLESSFQPLLKEAKELTSIIVAAIKTTKSNIKPK
jgi:four helix bundle protein